MVLIRALARIILCGVRQIGLKNCSYTTTLVGLPQVIIMGPPSPTTTPAFPVAVDQPLLGEVDDDIILT